MMTTTKKTTTEAINDRNRVYHYLNLRKNY